MDAGYVFEIAPRGGRDGALVGCGMVGAGLKVVKESADTFALTLKETVRMSPGSAPLESPSRP